MHRLHEGAQEVYAGVTDTIVLTLQGLDNLLPNYLTEAAHRREGVVLGKGVAYLDMGGVYFGMGEV